MNNYIKIYSPQKESDFLNNLISIGYSVINDEEHHVKRKYGDNNFLLIYIKKGTMILYNPNGKATQFYEGSFIIFAPNYNQNYKFTQDSKTEYYWFHFQGLEGLLKQLNIYPTNYFTKNIGINEKIINYWKKIITELQLELYCSQLESNIKLIQILTIISEEIYNKRNFKDNQTFNQITPAIMEMNSHYNENHNNGYYAKLCNMSESSFYHTFCKTFKTSPTKYINTIRIQIAENLLIETDMTIEKISTTIGYTTSQYFSKIFKEKHKIPPLKFRQKTN